MCGMENWHKQLKDVDESLLNAFHIWKGLIPGCHDDENMRKVDFVEEFCDHARERLLDLVPD